MTSTIIRPGAVATPEDYRNCGDRADYRYDEPCYRNPAVKLGPLFPGAARAADDLPELACDWPLRPRARSNEFRIAGG